MNQHLFLWAKTDRKSDTGRWHPLLFHMLDSANVASAMWQDSFAPALRQQFALWLDKSEEDAERLLSFWIALHDIGKASPAFQQKYFPAVSRLKDIGLGFPDPRLYSAAPHGLVTAWVLESLFSQTGLDRPQAKLIARALAGHHGTWPTSNELLSSSRSANLGGNWQAAWQAVRQQLFDVLIQTLNPPLPSLPEDTREQNAFLAVFSGWASTADWIASMEDQFPYSEATLPIEDYQRQSHQQAYDSIHRLGWAGWRPDGSQFDFKQIFSFAPNATQSAVLAAVEHAALPALLMIEAPTGCGKTEAALAAADMWLQRSGGRGFYVAMPTTATSNQMFQRVGEKFLHKRYPDHLINIQLAHSAALLSDDLRGMILQSVGEEDRGQLAAMGWFLPRKRTLLAPFGVGTVDQALMSVLQTRHFFVRLFGLSGKVIIFDEVHAYDTYMSALFCRLLEWLRAAGISVILLSATLPGHVRQSFVEAYSGRANPIEPKDIYPCFTLVTPETVRVEPIDYTEKRSIRLEWVSADAEQIAACLRGKLADGGCAAVICNTVGRAQEVFGVLRKAGICPESECHLFHARFPFYRRQEIETGVVNRFGKDPHPARPKCSIVVATQVIEQSLDLDFDVMISDLAPVDLLIQRAGRLHRHPHHLRSARLMEPQLFLCRPAQEDVNQPDFGDSRYVYEPYLLLRTLAVLRNEPVLHLPQDTVCLIESVYGEVEFAGLAAFEDLLADARKLLEKHRLEAAREAKSRLVLPPDDSGVIKMANLDLEDEDQSAHKSIQALTRQAAPGVSIICLHRQVDGSLNTQRDGCGEFVRLDGVPGRETVLNLLRCGLSIQNQAVVEAYAGFCLPEPWKKDAALRHHRLAEFTDGVCVVPGTNLLLKLDDDLGLRIEKEV